MRGYAEVSLLGNVGRDPEIKFNQQGEPIGIFSVACNEQWTTKAGEKHESVTWVNVTVFGGQAKIVRDYVTKGMPIAIRGAKLKIEEYEGKRYTKAVVDNFNGKITLLGGKAEKKEQPAPQQAGDDFQASDDDVPF